MIVIGLRHPQIMSKRPRTLESFFVSPPPKKRLTEATAGDASLQNQARSKHDTYPFALADLPSDLQETLNFVPSSEGQKIANQPDLDLVYYQPYIPKGADKELFEFLRSELFFYRVKLVTLLFYIVDPPSNIEQVLDQAWSGRDSNQHASLHNRLRPRRNLKLQPGWQCHS